MSRKKKKTRQAPAAFSPRNYMKEKARLFPVEKCWLNDDWQSHGIAQIVIVRKQPSGKFLFGVFLVDTLCLGLKSAFWEVNKVWQDVEELIESMQVSAQKLVEVEYVLVHNIIFGAIEFAEEYGFAPSKDFIISKYILDEDNEDVDLIDLEFGKDGKPFYISGPHDNARRIIQTLERTAGPGNYESRLKPNL